MSVERSLSAALWRELGGTSELAHKISFSGGCEGLPSAYQVGALASATVAVATLAAAELWSVRTGQPLRPVVVDRRLAGAAFRSERLLKPLGWSLAELWDPMAGDYRTKDSWIRLHTNYAHHRAAAVRVLGVAPEKAAVGAAVALWEADDLESEVVAAGGCAAALRTSDAWNRHPQGSAIAAQPLIAWEGRTSPEPRQASADAPLAGMRVLDLTRVIAGPVGTRFLAGYGAEVLRIDPPGFAEVPALLPESTLGKRCAALDLKKAQDRTIFDQLVAGADVMLHGYRPGAMAGLGYSDERLRALNPALVIASHCAYGWSGPWANRRGFDSLVQMSTGIAHPGNEGPPTPLPAQALDHATGYLLAAAACRALSSGRACARLSLARTAKQLVDLGVHAGSAAGEGVGSDIFERGETDWGPIERVRSAGEIEGCRVRWAVQSGPLGRHPPGWL